MVTVSSVGPPSYSNVVERSTSLGYHSGMPSTRWLSADEQRAWRGLLAMQQLLFDAIDAQLQRDAQMTHGYYEILVRLAEAPGRCLRMRDLAAASSSSRSRLSHAVARLEERGWVRRRCHETDRRGQVAELTDHGFAALAAAAPGHVELVRAALLDPLTPEQVAQLETISRTVVDNLEAAKVAYPAAEAPTTCRPTGGRPTIGRPAH